jgi:putative FmdB family regulatory protein
LNAEILKSGVIAVPIYEYRCESCEHRLEKLQKMSEGDLLDCPECKRPALKRLVSAAAFRLKGGGWYETDFKKDNKRNLADSSGEETPGKGSSANGSPDRESAGGDSVKPDKSSTESGIKKTESKPAAKSASKE